MQPGDGPNSLPVLISVVGPLNLMSVFPTFYTTLTEHYCEKACHRRNEPERQWNFKDNRDGFEEAMEIRHKAKKSSRFNFSSVSRQELPSTKHVELHGASSSSSIFF